MGLYYPPEIDGWLDATITNHPQQSVTFHKGTVPL